MLSVKKPIGSTHASVQTQRTWLWTPAFRLFLIFFLGGHAAIAGAEETGRIEAMRLLTPNAGWVGTATHLYVTSDSGKTWADVTPPSQGSSHPAIATTFFLAPAAGWTVSIAFDAKSKSNTIKVGRTTDFGRTWEILDSVPKNGGLGTAPLAGRADLFFLDEDHGWLTIGVSGSPIFHSAYMLATSDGGKTWQWPGGPGGGATSGQIVFSTLNDGWIVNGRDLQATHDGGKSWTELDLAAPQSIGPVRNVLAYSAPIFHDGRHGTLLARFAAENWDHPTLVAFQTSDAGRTWSADRSFALNDVGSELMPFAATATSVIHAETEDGRLHRTRILQGNAKEHVVAPIPLVSSPELWSGAGVDQLSFVNDNVGWALVSAANCLPGLVGCVQLLSTKDGGANWTNISPPNTRAAQPVPTPVPVATPLSQNGVQLQTITTLHRPTNSTTTTKGNSVPCVARKGCLSLDAVQFGSAGSSANIPLVTASNSATMAAQTPLASAAAGTLGVSGHLGFDTKYVKNVSFYMATWWYYSPYFDVAVYLPGVDFHRNVGQRFHPTMGHWFRV
jgi:photosystem II stability/assembly factor-like uncharacterized protein